MTLLFDRKYRLLVGIPKPITYVPDLLKPLSEGTTPIEWQKGDDWRTTSASTVDAIEIVDLQMTASIKGTSNNAANGNSPVVIEIFNLSAKTRDLVERNNNYVILEAGYAQDKELVMLFSGQVESFSTDRKDQNLITTLQCKEGYAPNNSVRFSKKFSKDQTYGDILNYIAAQYAKNGVPTGEIITDFTSAPTLVFDINSSRVLADRASNPPQNFAQLPVMLSSPAKTKLINGYSAVGYLHQVTENICKQIGYVSYITNGRLFIHPRGFTKVIEEFEFNSNQMKSIRKSGTKTTGSSISNGIEGIKLTTFMDGRLAIDKRIKILDGSYAGSYKIVTVSHELDYEQGKWDTTIICQAA